MRSRLAYVYLKVNVTLINNVDVMYVDFKNITNWKIKKFERECLVLAAPSGGIQYGGGDY